MYQVILVNDETSGRNYFYSYVESFNETLGNISTDVLPEFADINKARSCYWDESQWVYDSKKYDEIIAKNIENDAKSKVELTASKKLEVFSKLIQVEDAPSFDGFVLPNKYAHTWENNCKIVEGVPVIGWELVKVELENEKDGLTKETAIPWVYGDLVEKNLMYNVSGAIATAKRSGVPKNATDSTTFTYKLT